MKGAMLSNAGWWVLPDAAAAGPVPFDSVAVAGELGSTVTIVPGTMLILCSLANS